jgi:DUF2075 family protein/adenylylsulfate kinase-like enzyme
MGTLNYYYSDDIFDFLNKATTSIIGEISVNGRLGHTNTELFAWEHQISMLKGCLEQLNENGRLFFEFSIPRMGKRVDCLLIIRSVVFVIEFKVGQDKYLTQDIEQVWDYALDLKNFHKPSRDILLVPILVSTNAKMSFNTLVMTSHNDNLASPLRVNAKGLLEALNNTFQSLDNKISIDSKSYEGGSYSPTPTIIEAAISLYANHNVEAITRSDADAHNLTLTTDYINKTIRQAKSLSKKIICFVTGVPGAGKTLVGLKVATDHLDQKQGNTSVFLSGNRPLVDVLQEALTRDKVARERAVGKKITKVHARESVKAFIQMIHHYRDEYLRDNKAPYDHVAIFDEAQRAWTKEQTVKFMREKKGLSDFAFSEPEFLISCLDRHSDWSVIVCLVGGGQEINTGEAGISEWIHAVKDKFPHWETRISPNLYESEYNANHSISELQKVGEVVFNPDLHLSVSMRSYRAESLSRLIKEILDLNDEAKLTAQQLSIKYPIVLTRDIGTAKAWIEEKSRGTERSGIVASSQAYRLKPLAIDVKTKINHVNWFLDGKQNIRSSNFLEDVATEFQVQGLELDWACVIWDGDLRYSHKGWQTFSFVGDRWQNIHKSSRRQYLINAYRVLLTRARQGMIIVVPEGSDKDNTRKPNFYDETYNYLKTIGFETR